MTSEKFRRQLRQEATHWRTDGLIDDLLYQQLSDRYQFDRLEVTAGNRFTLILISLGCILLGLGVITFVAANWQVWPRPLRVGMLLSLFIGVNVAGFVLWRQHNDRWQSRLGQGLLLLGALILGANMALMGQMFHVGGSPAELCLYWGLGVLAMAYSLSLTTLGMVAILLVGIGYWMGWGELLNLPEFSWLGLLTQQMPLLAGVMYLPLAYRCRSRVLFLFTAIAVATSLINSLSAVSLTSGWMAAIAIVFPAALLWAYEDSFWADRLRSSQRVRPFRPLARALAVVYLGGLFYLGSFYGIWESTTSRSSSESLQHLSLLVSIVILVGLAILEWIYLVRLQRGNGLTDPTTVVIVGMMAVAALAVFYHLEIAPIPPLFTLIYNILLFTLAVGLVRESMGWGERRKFWFGILLLTLQVLSRLLEYNTDLLLKSFVFVLCGFGVIAAGLWFERHLRSLNPPSLPTLPEELP